MGASAVGGAALADEPRHVTITATANTTYDSNVAASDAATAAQRGIIPQDWIFDPGIGLDINEPIGRQAVFLKGSLGYEFHARNPQLNSQSIDLQGGVIGRTHSCEATLGGEYANARTSLQDLNVAVTRNIQDTETIRLDGRCGGRIGFGPTFSVSRQWTNNSAEPLRASDFDTFTVSAGIAYRRPSLGEIALLGSYSQTDFPDRDLAPGPASIQDGYRNYSVGVRFDRRLGARIQGTLQLSYAVLNPYVQSVEGFNGVDVRADISVRVSGRLTTHFGVVNGPEPTIVSNATYSLNTAYTAEADYQVNPRWTLKLAGADTMDHYKGALIVPGTDIQSESYWTITGTSHFQLSRRFAVELWASHQERNADINIYDYSDNRVGLSLSAAI
jgi:hypothetical protein